MKHDTNLVGINHLQTGIFIGMEILIRDTLFMMEYLKSMTTTTDLQGDILRYAVLVQNSFTTVAIASILPIQVLYKIINQRAKVSFIINKDCIEIKNFLLKRVYFKDIMKIRFVSKSVFNNYLEIYKSSKIPIVIHIDSIDKGKEIIEFIDSNLSKQTA